MSYVSLARKYRPRRFADMVGQESTTLALTNAIRLHREPHSVIFTGVRGVGKTTSARIYAKALNCERGPTAEPCDVCASCVAVAAGHHEDVLEIDGASNTGVDDVRALQETLGYVPQRSTYKIYIIDEVHMLSISAFNALLKTLEEPPQHVVFIFATTELHKVPETIQSRCQIFHLQKISRPVIAERVRAILSAEQIPFDEAALAVVAREGRGSMRDALTMLDQAIAVGGGQVSMEALKNMVGGSQALPVLELLHGLLRKDAKQILEVIGRWDQEGLAMSHLIEETAKACRNAFILRDLKGEAMDVQILELEDREQQILLELGEKAAPMDLNRLFRQLAKCLDDLRHADLDRYVVENYCLEWCFDPGLPDLQALMNLVAAGQPLASPAARQNLSASPAPEGPAMNLRERWKTSAPPPSTAVRPAVASPAAWEPTRAVASSTGKSKVETEKAASAPNRVDQATSQSLSASVPSTTSQDKIDASRAKTEALKPSAPAAAVSGLMKTALPQQEIAQPGGKTSLSTVEQTGHNPGSGASRTATLSPPTAPKARPPEPPIPPVKNQATVSNPTRPGTLMAPIEVAEEEAPPWVLQAEAARLDVVAAPAQEPFIPSPASKNEGFLKQMARKATLGTALVPPLAAAAPQQNPDGAPPRGSIWPENWRAFVEEWKKQKPLQGRVLEEAYILEYTPQRIRLAVEPNSMAGGKLLQQEVRRRLVEQFAQLFGFQGILEAVPKVEASSSKVGPQTADARDLGETLLEVKQRERELARENLRQRLEEHPMTREVISRFGGTIEQIELQ